MIGDAMQPSAMATLADVLLKGGALLILVFAAAALARRRSAAERALIWGTGLAGLLAVAIAAPLAPKWSWAVLPAGWGKVEAVAAGAESTAIAPQNARDEPAFHSDDRADKAAGSEASYSPGSPRTQEAASPPPPVAAAAVVSSIAQPSNAAKGEPAIPKAKPIALAWPRILLLGWGLGVLLALAPMGLGLMQVRRKLKRARPLGGADWDALMDELRGTLGIARRVGLLIGEAGEMPMAAGWLRETILLPAEAEGWPAAMRRGVLAHELAHVRRRDCLMQALGRLAAALHWPDPLAWIALARLRGEREQACDDLALAAGSAAADYAATLLEIARTMQARQAIASAAATMARTESPQRAQPGKRPGKIERRLLAILDASRRRGSVGRRGILLGLAAILLVALPLSMAQLTESEAYRNPDPVLRYLAWETRDDQVWNAAPGHRGTSPKARAIWTPDGTAVAPGGLDVHPPETFFDPPGDGYTRDSPQARYLIVSFAFGGEMPYWTELKPEGAEGVRADGARNSPDPERKGLVWQTYTLSAATTATLSNRIAFSLTYPAGEWREAGTLSGTPGGSVDLGDGLSARVLRIDDDPKFPGVRVEIVDTKTSVSRVCKAEFVPNRAGRQKLDSGTAGGETTISGPMGPGKRTWGNVAGLLPEMIDHVRILTKPLKTARYEAKLLPFVEEASSAVEPIQTNAAEEGKAAASGPRVQIRLVAADEAAAAVRLPLAKDAAKMAALEGDVLINERDIASADVVNEPDGKGYGVALTIKPLPMRNFYMHMLYNDLRMLAIAVDGRIVAEQLRGNLRSDGNFVVRGNFPQAEAQAIADAINAAAAASANLALSSSAAAGDQRNRQNPGARTQSQTALGDDRFQMRLVAADGDAGALKLPKPDAGAFPPSSERVIGTLDLEGKIILDSSDVASAEPTAPEGGRGYGVALTLTPEGAGRLAAAARANVGRRMALLSEGYVIAAPVIREPIEGGKLVIDLGVPHLEAQARADTIARQAPAKSERVGGLAKESFSQSAMHILGNYSFIRPPGGGANMPAFAHSAQLLRGPRFAKLEAELRDGDRAALRRELYGQLDGDLARWRRLVGEGEGISNSSYIMMGTIGGNNSALILWVNMRVNSLLLLLSRFPAATDVHRVAEYAAALGDETNDPIAGYLANGAIEQLAKQPQPPAVQRILDDYRDWIAATDVKSAFPADGPRDFPMRTFSKSERTNGPYEAREDDGKKLLEIYKKAVEFAQRIDAAGKGTATKGSDTSTTQTAALPVSELPSANRVVPDSPMDPTERKSVSNSLALGGARALWLGNRTAPSGFGIEGIGLRPNEMLHIKSYSLNPDGTPSMKELDALKWILEFHLMVSPSQAGWIAYQIEFLGGPADLKGRISQSWLRGNGTGDRMNPFLVSSPHPELPFRIRAMTLRQEPKELSGAEPIPEAMIDENLFDQTFTIPAEQWASWLNNANADSLQVRNLGDPASPNVERFKSPGGLSLHYLLDPQILASAGDFASGRISGYDARFSTVTLSVEFRPEASARLRAALNDGRSLWRNAIFALHGEATPFGSSVGPTGGALALSSSRIPLPREFALAVLGEIAKAGGEVDYGGADASTGAWTAEEKPDGSLAFVLKSAKEPSPDSPLGRYRLQIEANHVFPAGTDPAVVLTVPGGEALNPDYLFAHVDFSLLVGPGTRPQALTLLLNGKEIQMRLTPDLSDPHRFLLHLVHDTLPNLAPLAPGHYRVSTVYRGALLLPKSDRNKPALMRDIPSNEIEFDVVEKLPPGELTPDARVGWDRELQASLTASLSDAGQRFYPTAYPDFFHLEIDPQRLPVDLAFEVYAQREDETDREKIGEFSAIAGKTAKLTLKFHSEMLDWRNAGETRWRLILVPSRQIAIDDPGVRSYYGREFDTDWMAFVPSAGFEEQRKLAVDATAALTFDRFIDTSDNLRAGITAGLVSLPGHIDPLDARKVFVAYPQNSGPSRVSLDQGSMLAGSPGIESVSAGRGGLLDVKIATNSRNRFSWIASREHQGRRIAFVFNDYVFADTPPLETTNSNGRISVETGFSDDQTMRLAEAINASIAKEAERAEAESKAARQ